MRATCAVAGLSLAVLDLLLILLLVKRERSRNRELAAHKVGLQTTVAAQQRELRTLSSMLALRGEELSKLWQEHNALLARHRALLAEMETLPRRGPAGKFRKKD